MKAQIATALQVSENQIKEVRAFAHVFLVIFEKGHGLRPRFVSKKQFLFNAMKKTTKLGRLLAEKHPRQWHQTLKIEKELQSELKKQLLASGLPNHESNVLSQSDEIVPAVLKAYRDQISNNAPDVYFSNSEMVEMLLPKVLNQVEVLDKQNELVRILDEWQNREDFEKHGV